MLKIKDNVDLKEIEKFGFKYNENHNDYFVTQDNNTYISICCQDRIIDFVDEWYGKDFELMDYLFDIIQAGLIEKVKEK